MRMKRHYTTEEIQFVKKNIRGRSYINMTRLFNELFGLGLTLKQMETLICKHRLLNGIGSYLPGHVPANKEKKKKKNWWKTSPGNHCKVGTERETRYRNRTYIEIKTAEPSVWKRKHTAIWEKANGKVPKGHIVIFADGNTRNFSLDNLLLITRRELLVMNRFGLISSHKELTKAGKAVADIKMAIAARKRKSHSKQRRPA